MKIDPAALQGVTRKTVPVPDPITADWLRGEAARDERILRLQYREGLPDEWEAALEANEPATIRGALSRWQMLRHFWALFRGGLRPDSSWRDERRAAMAAALRREPVRLELSGRQIEVTSRSYTAMDRMACHELRIREIDEAAARCEELERSLAAEIESAGGGDRRRARRRLARVREAHRELLAERILQRQALFAHAFTPSGAPAEGLSDAPAWWREIGPLEEAALFAALFEAGPGRIRKLGPPPDGGKPSRAMREWGWMSLLAQFEREMDLEPAAAFNRDLAQITAWIRAGAPDPIGEDV